MIDYFIRAPKFFRSGIKTPSLKIDKLLIAKSHS